MPFRFQNNSHTTNRVPSYYANNNVYPGAYAQNEAPTRVSRRVHDGLSLTQNFGLDTTSDDINSSPFSSPFYINGRYNSDNLTTQRANSASVQGVEKLLVLHNEYDDFTDNDIQTTIEMWQGKQIKFEIPYHGKVVGQTIKIKNTQRCTGILSIYLSAKDGGPILSETCIDLCQVSEDKFEKVELTTMTPVARDANPRGKLYVRLEIWDEIDQTRSDNPFNTGRKIEISATGAGNHYACEYKLGDKNAPVDEQYEYVRRPSRPLLGLVYNDYTSVPVVNGASFKYGATISTNGYRYDVFCFKDGTHAEVAIYDNVMNKIVENTNIRVDGRLEQLSIVQVKNTVYYDDGYSPFQKFTVGQWNSSIVPPKPGDAQPVIGAKILLWHNNRIYRSGFATDPNLVQFSVIEDSGPDPENLIYRFYVPDDYPQATSISPITAIVELDPQHLMIFTTDSVDQYESNSAKRSAESSIPAKVSIYSDGIGVQSQGDVCNFKGTLYSFDPDEGIRRFTGSIWQKLPTTIDSHYDRVDMTKPRKIWGYADKLYFNYTDKIDGKAKALIWDSNMNYQQYPFFQDYDLPFCDVRKFDDYNLIGSHPDFPCIMRLYAEDTWRRLDSPIVFQRDTKYLSLPGNAADMIVRRVHNKVISNCNRWWWFGITSDKQSLKQERNVVDWYRMPCWDTLSVDNPIESPFPFVDQYEENATIRLTISNLRIQGESFQEKIKCKTFRRQANLISTMFEAAVRQYN